MKNATVLVDNEIGVIYRIKKIPSSMFEFFIHEKHKHKDGTKTFVIGVSPTADSTKSFIFTRIRGTRSDAEKKLEEIIKSYSKKEE